MSRATAVAPTPPCGARVSSTGAARLAVPALAPVPTGLLLSVFIGCGHRARHSRVAPDAAPPPDGPLCAARGQVRVPRVMANCRPGAARVASSDRIAAPCPFEPVPRGGRAGGSRRHRSFFVSSAICHPPDRPPGATSQPPTIACRGLCEVRTGYRPVPGPRLSACSLPAICPLHGSLASLRLPRPLPGAPSLAARVIRAGEQATQPRCLPESAGRRTGTKPACPAAPQGSTAGRMRWPHPAG